MFFNWLEQLKEPVLNEEIILILKDNFRDAQSALVTVPIHVSFIIEYLLGFVARLNKIIKIDLERFIQRLIQSLTQAKTFSNNKSCPSFENLKLIEQKEADSLVCIFLVLYEFVSKKFVIGF